MDIKKTWLVEKPIAHRGLHNAKFPENSLAAFEHAIKHGFAIETDVRAIDDGAPVIFHDEGLSRMTGRDGYVCNLKKEELAELRLLKTEEKIPLFSEFLEFVNGRAPILIEIKNVNKIGALEKAVIDALADYKGEFAVQAFNPHCMEFFRINAPHVIRGQLSCYFKKDSNLSRVKRYALKRLMLNKASRPDFIAYSHENLPNRWVSRTKLPVLAWTVRSNAEYERVKEFCDNIIFENFKPQ